jgi:hypothetical protein
MWRLGPDLVDGEVGTRLIGACAGLPWERCATGEFSLDEGAPVVAQGLEASKLVVAEFAKIPRRVVVQELQDVAHGWHRKIV